MTTTVTGVVILIILVLITLLLIEGIVMFVGSLVGWDGNYICDEILSHLLWIAIITMGLCLIGCVVLLFLTIISIIIGYVI